MKTAKTVSLTPPTSNEDTGEAPDAMGRAVTQRRSEVRLGREVQARIGQQLRAMYEDIVSQGVPQHIADLVRRLGNDDEVS